MTESVTPLFVPISLVRCLLLSLCLVPFLSSAALPRIVGGESVAGEQWQAVSLQYGRGNGIYHFCGASIIAERWLLTAAHCVNANGIDANRDGLLDQPVSAFIGQSELGLSNRTDYRLEVAAIIIHPDFDAYTLANDIALLYLADAVTGPTAALGEEHIDELAQNNAIHRAFGWGATDRAGVNFPSTLQQVDLEHITCQYNDVPQHVYCAGGQALKDACFGDSGGPAYVLQQGRWLQYGITSFGAAGRCGSAGLPTAFTFVPAFKPWIKQQQGLLHFGLTPVFERISQRQTVQLFNTSTSAMNIARVSLSSSAKLTWFDDCTGQRLEPDEFCNLQILLEGQNDLINDVVLEAISETGITAIKRFAIALEADNQVEDLDRAAGQAGGGAIGWLNLFIALMILRERAKLD
ncbi:S1 family peptidase [Motilimonas pumila]|uniref:Serine protease n=1 Tax=Motilimonas pumila TaxID=2303987 RepID=A0A418YEX3_9GAMM|nr:serine protease [Motilimonas pumila]RJG47594.1 serine protease [Motilimonas pumila]